MKTVLINCAIPDPARNFNYRWDEDIQDVVRVSPPSSPSTTTSSSQSPPRPTTPSRTRSVAR